MDAKGSELWMEICDSIVDDKDHCMVDTEKTKKTPSKNGGFTVDLAFMDPYKCIDSKSRSHFAKEIISLAVMADRGNGHDQIRVTYGPVYHFFNEDTVNRFKDRVLDIIEAAKI